MPKELKIATHEQVVQSRNFLNLSHHERDYITALHLPTNILKIVVKKLTGCIYTSHITLLIGNLFQLNFHNTK